MTVRVGANPICWSNDDMLEIGGDTPLEQCLSEARAAGFVGMELGNKFPRDAAKLGPILKVHGHALVSGWYSTRAPTGSCSPSLRSGSRDSRLHRRRPPRPNRRATANQPPSPPPKPESAGLTRAAPSPKTTSRPQPRPRCQARSSR